MEKMKYVSIPKKVEGWHYEAKCEFCGQAFEAKRSTAKFCSDTCRTMSHYKKETPKATGKTKKPKEILNFKTKRALCSALNIGYDYFQLESGKEKERGGYLIKRLAGWQHHYTAEKI